VVGWNGGGRVALTETHSNLTQQPPPSQGSGYTVKIANLCFRSAQGIGREVLREISLVAEPGEFVAIVGPNGAGKSSILRAIAGEIRPTSGTVEVGWQPVTKPINRVIDGVGVVHQVEEADLIDHLTVAQNIAIRQLLGGGHPRKLWAMPDSWRREVASIIGSHVHIGQFNLDTIVGTMSGGEKQILSIAIATHIEHQRNPCRLLLLDEHTSRLDPRNADKVMQYTREQVKSTRATTLMVTHRYKDALQDTDRVVIVRNGQIKCVKKTQEIGATEELNQLVELDA
jgi:putative tryptophan/tyrosine transport system ATP-binding protein